MTDTQLAPTPLDSPDLQTESKEKLHAFKPLVITPRTPKTPSPAAETPSPADEAKVHKDALEAANAQLAELKALIAASSFGGKGTGKGETTGKDATRGIVEIKGTEETKGKEATKGIVEIKGTEETKGKEETKGEEATKGIVEIKGTEETKGKEETKGEESAKDKDKEPNSNSHNQEYKAWVRACKSANRAKEFPQLLQTEYEQNKQGMFAVFMSCGKDMKQMYKVCAQRILKKKDRTEESHGGRKFKYLVELYGQVKAEDLRDRCVKLGKWFYDPNFPKDESEIFYVIFTDASMTRTNELEENITGEAQSDGLDRESAELLFEGSDSVLNGQQGLSFAGMSEKGSSSLFDQINKHEGTTLNKQKPEAKTAEEKERLKREKQAKMEADAKEKEAKLVGAYDIK